MQPPDADIFIDREAWHTSPEEGARLVVQVAGGLHHVEVRKDGYEPFAIEVNVRPGETAPVNVSLTRAREAGADQSMRYFAR